MEDHLVSVDASNDSDSVRYVDVGRPTLNFVLVELEPLTVSDIEVELHC